MLSGMLLPAVLLISCKPDEPVSAAQITLSGEITCEDPSLRDSLGPLEALELDATEPMPGAGVVAADFDGDEIIDLFLPDLESCTLLLGRGDGTFLEVTENLPVISPCVAWGGSAADVDSDGDLDLFVARTVGSDVLLINDGTGVFSDNTEAAGLSAQTGPTAGGSWADMDRDGDLDLFLARHSPSPSDPDLENNPGEDVSEDWGSANSLLENQGDGRLVDVSDRLTMSERYGFTFVGAWQDLNGDRLPDLYQLNDFGDRVFANQYMQNRCSSGGCAFKDASEDSALDLEIEALGVGIGDLNGDGRPDFGISDKYRLHLLISEGETWYDAAASMGLRLSQTKGQRNTWGGELVDLDNDGDLDFIATAGPVERAILSGEHADQPDGLWIQEDGQFSDQGEAWDVAHTDIGRGFVVADLNNDGYPDVVKRRYKGGPTLVMRSRCGSASWLKVRLRDSRLNTHMIGAEIIARTPDGEQVRWIHAGSTSLASSGPPEALFGLGDAEEVEVEVRWPNGREQVFSGLAPNQIVEIRR